MKGYIFRKIRGIASSLAILLIALSGGCPFSRDNEPYVVKVDSKKLTVIEFQEMIPVSYRGQITPEMKDEIIDRWVKEELLYEEALRRKVHKDPSIKRILGKVRRDLLVSDLKSQLMTTIPTIRDERIAEYYENHRENFVRAFDEVKLRIILLGNESGEESKKRADDLRLLIKMEKILFSEAARKYSKHSSAENGGQIGVVSQGMIDEELWDVVEESEPGKVSIPALTDEGYYLLIMDELYEPGSIKALEQVREEIRNILIVEEQNRKMAQFIKSLRAKSEVEIP